MKSRRKKRKNPEWCRSTIKFNSHKWLTISPKTTSRGRQKGNKMRLRSIDRLRSDMLRIYGLEFSTRFVLLRGELGHFGVKILFAERKFGRIENDHERWNTGLKRWKITSKTTSRGRQNNNKKVDWPLTKRCVAHFWAGVQHEVCPLERGIRAFWRKNPVCWA